MSRVRSSTQGDWSQGVDARIPIAQFLSPNIYISPRVAVVALSSTDQPVRGGLSAIRYRRSRAALPRFLPLRDHGTRPSRYGIQARDVWFVMAGPGGCHRDW